MIKIYPFYFGKIKPALTRLTLTQVYFSNSKSYCLQTELLFLDGQVPTRPKTGDRGLRNMISEIVDFFGLLSSRIPLLFCRIIRQNEAFRFSSCQRKNSERSRKKSIKIYFQVVVAQKYKWEPKVPVEIPDWHNGEYGDLVIQPWQVPELKKMGYLEDKMNIDQEAPTHAGVGRGLVTWAKLWSAYK